MSVTRWLKKPIVVEAILYDGTNADEILKWCGGWAKITRSEELLPGDGWLTAEMSIETNEGPFPCRAGDYVVKEPFPSGGRRFYPVKPDIMSDTYTRVHTRAVFHGEYSTDDHS